MQNAINVQSYSLGQLRTPSITEGENAPSTSPQEFSAIIAGSTSAIEGRLSRGEATRFGRAYGEQDDLHQELRSAITIEAPGRAQELPQDFREAEFSARIDGPFTQSDFHPTTPNPVLTAFEGDIVKSETSSGEASFSLRSDNTRSEHRLTQSVEGEPTTLIVKNGSTAPITSLAGTAIADPNSSVQTATNPTGAATSVSTLTESIPTIRERQALTSAPEEAVSSGAIAKTAGAPITITQDATNLGPADAVSPSRADADVLQISDSVPTIAVESQTSAARSGSLAAQSTAEIAQSNSVRTATAFEIVSFSQASDGTFELRLDPPDLGGVSIHFFEDETGAKRALVIADLRDTSELLRRHADLLHRDLARMGAGDVTLSFADRRDGSRHMDNHSNKRMIRFGETPELQVALGTSRTVSSVAGRIDLLA